MKNNKRMLSALLALVMAAALLTGCGGGDATPAQPTQTETDPQTESQAVPSQADQDTVLLTNRGAQNPVLGTPEKPLNAEEVYASVEYIPEMFYGQYRLVGGDTAQEQYLDSVSFMTINAEHQYRYDRAAAEEQEITTIPYQITAGPGNLYTLNPETHIPEYHWMKATFLRRTEDRYLPMELFFAYDVEGTTLRMRMLKNVELDPETNEVLSYEFGDLVLTYEFAFRGLSLTLSYGDDHATLEAARVGENYTEVWMAFIGTVLPGEKQLDHITYIHFNYDERDGFTQVSYLFDEDATDAMSRESAASISKDGLITFTIPYPDGEKTYQFVYFYLNNDGFILTDGADTYFYHSWYGDYYSDKLSDVLGEGIDPRELSEQQAEQLIETQTSVIDELSESFEEYGVSVDLNRDTGRVTLDSGVLFASDSAELSPEGQEYLEHFVRAYAPVILNGEGAGSVAQILIEGHTDSDGSYDYNLALSERRAQTVADACIALEPGLKPYIVIKGCASDEPVLLPDGAEDKDASRRVVFKFILDVG
jgi:chemotaxis protein MotB